MDGFTYARDANDSAPPGIPTFGEVWVGDPFQESDPYRDAAPVCRGGIFSGGFRGDGPEVPACAALAPSPDADWRGSFSSALGEAHLAPQYTYYSPSVLGGKQFGFDATPSEEYVFLEGDEARDLPKDPFFQLLATTLYVKAPAAHHLGNVCLSFLRDELSAPAVKLRRAKYTAKADVLHRWTELSSGLSHKCRCTVKLRAYRVARGVLAVELQRREGDAIAFMNIFKMFTQYLKDRFQMAEGLPSDASALPLEAGAPGPDEHASVAGDLLLDVPCTGA